MRNTLGSEVVWSGTKAVSEYSPVHPPARWTEWPHLIRSGTMTENTKQQTVRRLDELSSWTLHSQEKWCRTLMMAWPWVSPHLQNVSERHITRGPKEERTSLAIKQDFTRTELALSEEQQAWLWTRRTTVTVINPRIRVPHASCTRMISIFTTPPSEVVGIRWEYWKAFKNCKTLVQILGFFFPVPPVFLVWTKNMWLYL